MLCKGLLLCMHPCTGCLFLMSLAVCALPRLTAASALRLLCCCSEQQLQANLAAATDPTYSGRDPFVAAFVSLCVGELPGC